LRGADTDLFHTIRGIQSLGHEVCLFAAKNTESRERAAFEPDEMPFPAVRLDFQPREINDYDMPHRFRTAVDEWAPDAVFMGFGYFLKPFVTTALSHYPMAARFYAYELSCPRDLRAYGADGQCQYNYLESPDICRQCTFDHLAPEIKTWRLLSWPQEYVAARAYHPRYYERLLAFIRQCRTMIVYNHIQQRHLEPFHQNIHIVPGGVTIADFVCASPKNKSRKVILMTGRAEDPSKGLVTLREAGAKLAERRNDFEIIVTHADPDGNTDWFKSTGWRDQKGLADLYQQADICVVPSVWDEPFGIVAVEAMASGLPVCASRTGGLQEVVVDGITGLLFERRDSAGLAACLERLLDNAEMRCAMGIAGRRRAEEEYDWEHIAKRYYPPILEDLMR